MPELPEVEITRQGILPYVKGKKVTRIIVRNRRLRWPLPHSLNKELPEQIITDVQRRAKYLLFTAGTGTMLIHLGMSGSLSIVSNKVPAKKHDHMDIYFNNRKILRFNDPRRFGSVLWTRRPPEQHRLLKFLGPEPLSEAFHAEYLYRLSRKRKVAIKNLIMNSRVVVGVGNIYASEALFLAGINPKRTAAAISMARCGRLVGAIQSVLESALKSGGSTLKNFVAPNGQAGYFQHHFQVYGKAGQPCVQCGEPIKQVTIGQRSTCYCTHCQK